MFFRKQKIKNIVFYRDFKEFRGGHLKVWHYFNYLMDCKKYNPSVFFSTESVFSDSNPWINNADSSKIVQKWEPEKAEIIFMAGYDWSNLLSNKKYLSVAEHIPVINLIQGFGHSRPGDIRYQYLNRKAIRICVSNEVAQAIINTGQVNGPVFVNSNGVDKTSLSSIQGKREYDVCIVGIKNPDLAFKINEYLVNKGLNTLCIQEPIGRESFLNVLQNSTISLTLPQIEEGFYLPALEAMAAGSLVICPDCNGNRSFCINNETCLMPAYEYGELVDSVMTLFESSSTYKKSMQTRALKMVKNYNINNERSEFLRIINQADSLWKQH